MSDSSVNRAHGPATDGKRKIVRPRKRFASSVMEIRLRRVVL